MLIQITDTQLQLIKKIFSEHLSDIEYRAFGSRAKGTAKEYSDLDIVLIDKKPISLQTLSALEEAFSESDLPFKVDLVDWQRITPEFQDKIREEWIQF